MSAVTTFLTTGYINYFTCGFQNTDVWACITGGRILPAAFIAGFWGTVKLLSTQFGVFSQLDTPDYQGETVPGGRTENVQVFYYVLDTLSESFWLVIELTLGSALLWYSALAMIGYNIASGTFVWFGLIGLVQAFAMVFWTASLLIRLVYNLVNIDYLVNKYDVATYSTITFYDPLSIISSDLETTQQIIYYEQLLFGNRRSMLYANIMMSVVLALHPLTFIPSWFFLFQVPAGILFELAIYPLFPQYDTPYIPWTTYFEYVINGLQEEEASSDLDPVNPKDKDDELQPIDNDKLMLDLAEQITFQ